MNELERLLRERRDRLERLRSHRQLLAREDLTRCLQGWRRPWHQVYGQ